MVDYFLCGLSVSSDLLLPGILQSEVPASEPDVVVLRAQVPLPYADEDGNQLNWRVEGADVLFRVPGIVRFHIAGGRKILFELEGLNSDNDVVPFLLSTAIGIVLHQRQLLVLHASAVILDGHAVAICAPSGTGKSTLAAALCNTGCSFLSDDISVIHTDAQGQPFVTPDGRQHRLWADSVAQLSLAERQGPAVRASLLKFHVDPVSAQQPIPAPLRAIVVLREARGPQLPGIVRLSPADAFGLVRSDVFRNRLASRLGRDPQLFIQTAALLPRVRILRLNRHGNFARLGDDVQLLLEHLEQCK